MRRSTCGQRGRAYAATTAGARPFRRRPEEPSLPLVAGVPSGPPYPVSALTGVVQRGTMAHSFDGAAT